MKADSYVFTGIQRPMPLLGLPPRIFVLVAAAAGVAFGACVSIGIAYLGLPVAVVVFIVLWLLMWRRTNRDAHFGNYVFALPKFWAGRSRPAQIIAGSRTKIKGTL